MELPRLGSFRCSLEEDRIFRDYFNAFLNLPVFAVRLFYSAEEKCFLVHPHNQSPYHTLDTDRVLPWVHDNRLPLFWGTELFLEYRLCKRLTEDAGLKESLSSVLAMQQFRSLLSDSAGEAACLFWLDVEHLKYTTEKRVLRKIISRIQQLYIIDGAPFSLDLQVQPSSCQEGSPPVSTRVTALFRMQESALNSLTVYWCKKYSLHVGQSPVQYLCTGSSYSHCARQKQPMDRPRIVTDVGESENTREARKPQSVKLTDSPLKLPSLNTSGGILHREDNTPHTEQPSRLLPSPSKQNPLHPLPPSPQNPLHPLPPSPLPTPTLSATPFLSASLRSDCLAGRPLLRFLTSSATHDHRQAVRCLLFWESIEGICTQDELQRKHGRSSSGRGCHGCPHRAFFGDLSYPIARDLEELVMCFVEDKAPLRVELQRAVRNELLLLLPKGLGQSLLLCTQEDAVEKLLLPWKQYLQHDHKLFMEACASTRLLPRLTSPRYTEHSPAATSHFSLDNIVQHTYGAARLSLMWQALGLCEAIRYPGVGQLPSRQSHTAQIPPKNCDSEETENLDDIDVAHLPGLPYNPMVTTIYSVRSWKPQMRRHKVLCHTKPLYSCDPKTLPPPKSFGEVLRDPDHVELFLYFLKTSSADDGGEDLLLFWMAVEEMKASLGNNKICNSKARKICRRFLTGGAVKDLLFQDVPEQETERRLSPQQLLEAQATVTDELEKRWYCSYVENLTTEEKVEEKAEEDQEKTKKQVCREHTKHLWRMFAHNVMSFRQGLMSPATAALFHAYLKEEVVKGNTGSQKKVVGTRVINATKLLSDLSFWAEVERYKDLADLMSAAKTNGTHTPEDDIIIYKKAHTIINCYIDSAVAPRVQINIPNELVQYILDSISQGLVSRGLFHEAALNIFSVLILYWKKFCMVRFAPQKCPSSSSIPLSRHSVQSDHTSSPTLPQFVSTFPSISTFTTERRESQLHVGGPTLSFSLISGLRWLKLGTQKGMM